MKNDELRAFIKDNVMTFSEVSTYLNMNKQSIYNLIKKKELIPAKYTPKCVIFSKNDVIRYHNKEHYKRLEETKYKTNIAYGSGGTSRAIAYFEENVNNIEAIIKITIYFYDEDAIFDNNFYIYDDYSENELLIISTPRMVIEFNDGTKPLWLHGVNCGYGGTGPNGSIEILKKIGISSNMALEVEKHKKITYYKENNEWNYFPSNSFNDGINKDPFGHFYLFNDSIVLLEDFDLYHNMIKNNTYTTEDFIKKYIKFIPQPIKIAVLSREYAIANGYYKDSITNVYQIIIIDSSNRQIWIKKNIDDLNNIRNNQSIKDILESLGYELDKLSLPQILSEWIDKKPFVELNISKK